MEESFGSTLWEWIKRSVFWIFAVLVAILTLGAYQARRKEEAADEEVGRAKADKESVQQERARTADESTADLYKDLTK